MAVVQTAFAKANTSSVSVTFTNNIAAGNSVIVCLQGTGVSSSADNATYYATLAPSSGGDTFGRDVADLYNGASSIWSEPSSAGGYKTVTVTLHGGTNNLGVSAWMYEVSNLLGLDQTVTGHDVVGGPYTTFSSTITGTTSQPGELVVGVGGGISNSSSATATGPSSGGWTNLTAQVNENTTNVQYFPGVSGYQLVTSLGAFTYSGTLTGACVYDVGCVATYKSILISSDSGAGTEGTASVLAGISSSDSAAGTDGTGSVRILPITSSDSGIGTDSQVLISPLFKADTDSGAGTDSQALLTKSDRDSGTGTDSQILISPLFKSDTDSGAGTETASATIGIQVHSADSGTGTEAQSMFYAPRDFDGAAGYESAFYEPVATTGITGVAMEGFSLTRASVLGATGTESAQLYAAQAITMTPNATVINNSADDDVISIWVVLNSADISVQAGFMPFSVIALLGGTTVVSSGLSPHDYYGMPLWTQYQHNQPQVPMAIRMSSRNSPGAARTMDIVLYRVSISVLDFTGIVYKTGLQVNYTGKVMFSATDEAGNTLPGLEMGRVVSYAGTLTGAFASLPFKGI